MGEKIGKLGMLGELSKGREYWWIIDELNRIIEKQGEIIDVLNRESAVEGVYLSAEIVERRGKIGKEILNIINNWGEYTSEGSIYWEPCGGKDPEQEIVKEVLELMDAYSESVMQDVYEEFLVWEMERNLTKEQKEIFDDLLSKLTTK